MIRAALISIAVASFFMACGGDDDAEPSAVATSAPALASPGQSDTLTVGDTATLNNNAKVTVTRIDTAPTVTEAGRERKPDTGMKWALVSVRLEGAMSLPDFTVECAAGEGKRYTYLEADALKDGDTEGDILMSVPDPCADGRLTAKATGVFTSANPQKVASWKLQ